MNHWNVKFLTTFPEVPELSQDGGLTRHAAEIPYVMQAIPFGAGVTMQDYWTRFAIAGDPNGAGLPRWERYDPKGQRHVTFDPKRLLSSYRTLVAV